MEDGYPDKSYKNNNKQDNRSDIKYGSGSQDNLLHSQYISPKQDKLIDDTHREIKYGLNPQDNLQSNANKQDTRRDTGLGFGSQDNLLHSQYISPKQDNLVDDTHCDVRYGLSPQVNLQDNKNKQETRRDTGFGLRSQDNLLTSQYIKQKQDNLIDDTHREIRYRLEPQVNLQGNKNKQETRRDTGFGLRTQDNLLHSQYINPRQDNSVDDTHRDIGYGLEYFFTFKHISKKQNTLVNDTYLDFRSGLASQYAAIILVNDTYLDFGTGLASQNNLENKTGTRWDIGFGASR
ncbi:11046_t:CDS:2 [Funneliformis mosseae]|uniref:11046_t:CDS:1 n=1 Tax=Funneliformis mosseae TaxID=27381 RepID=A0A9N9DW34_FUNMO|nr:11046_t:CDS:2 [Funneliformis mosseae]